MVTITIRFGSFSFFLNFHLILLLELICTSLLLAFSLTDGLVFLFGWPLLLLEQNHDLVTEQYLNMEVPLVGIPFNLSVLLPLLTNYYLM